jgi:phosphoglycolate phosphatase-like HAD superfamily hydrolase
MEKLMGLRPEAMLYVGDRPWDVAAANVAGWTSVRTIQAGSDDWPSHALKAHQPDFVISSFDQLPEVL